MVFGLDKVKFRENFFNKSPKVLEKYQIGGLITRENFLSFLINSFAISRGDSEKQRVFMLWASIRAGFDIEKVWEDFKQKGAFDAFSNEERESFLKSFNGIKAHGKFLDESGVLEPEVAVRKELEHLFNLVAFYEEVGYDELIERKSVDKDAREMGWDDFSKKYFRDEPR